MRSRRMRVGWMLVISIIASHILLGAYAVYDGGQFGFGFNSPERYVYHRLAGSEARFTISGAAKYIVGDLCLQACPGCPMDCYSPADLSLDCDRGCSLSTLGGRVAVREGDTFDAVLDNGILYTGATFRCYGGVCGFDIKAGENLTYSADLPDGVRRI